MAPLPNITTFHFAGVGTHRSGRDTRVNLPLSVISRRLNGMTQRTIIPSVMLYCTYESFITAKVLLAQLNLSKTKQTIHGDKCQQAHKFLWRERNIYFSRFPKLNLYAVWRDNLVFPLWSPKLKFLFCCRVQCGVFGNGLGVIWLYKKGTE